MPSDHPLPPVQLRPFEPRDYPRLLNAIHSPQELVQWAGPYFHFPLDQAQLEAYRASAQGGTAVRRIYTACDAAGEPVGHIELNEIDGYSARLCRAFINPSLRGRGFGRAMVRRAVRIGFADLGLRRIDLGVYDFNTAAIRCYMLEGFVKEGHLRMARPVGDEIWSTDLMAILRDEWLLREGVGFTPGAEEIPHDGQASTGCD